MDEEDKTKNDQAADSSSSGDKAQDAAPSRKKSINDYYGHKIGFFQTLSLVLNALLMVYAQVGQSGIVLSSLNPNPTDGHPIQKPICTAAHQSTIAGPG